MKKPNKGQKYTQQICHFMLCSFSDRLIRIFKSKSSTKYTFIKESNQVSCVLKRRPKGRAVELGTFWKVRKNYKLSSNNSTKHVIITVKLVPKWYTSKSDFFHYLWTIGQRRLPHFEKTAKVVESSLLCPLIVFPLSRSDHIQQSPHTAPPSCWCYWYRLSDLPHPFFQFLKRFLVV